MSNTTKLSSLKLPRLSVNRMSAKWRLTVSRLAHKVTSRESTRRKLVCYEMLGVCSNRIFHNFPCITSLSPIWRRFHVTNTKYTTFIGRVFWSNCKLYIIIIIIIIISVSFVTLLLRGNHRSKNRSSSSVKYIFYDHIVIACLWFACDMGYVKIIILYYIVFETDIFGLYAQIFDLSASSIFVT